MSIFSLLASLTKEEAEKIIVHHDLMRQPEYGKACIQARLAASGLHRQTWSRTSIMHINALLIGLRKIRFEESYGVIKLMSAVECYSFAVVGMNALTFEEYNMVIGPVAVVLEPGMFQEEQSWIREPIPQDNRYAWR